ncbi:MAG: hypothetical protein QG616_1269 [Pseudomonadota bacterium]|nr:hypothetical protein [Pseudomonadota bacterium]MDQ5918876.1 hypothetical protein [Pseudomonadota bacterium]
MHRRSLILLPLAFLAACATRMGADGKTQTVVDARYLAKGDIDRVIDTARHEVVDGLFRFAEKLYRRNPREFRKGPAPTLEGAMARLRNSKRLDFPELGGKRGGAAAMLAFREDYPGDRVLALMAGLLAMVYVAFEDKDDFYILDDLDEQKLYNCARNLETAMWKLSVERTSTGELVLLSNELDPNNRNLSFEREFGRITGVLDFLARVVADKHGRIVSKVAQSVASAVFLPVGGL